MKIVCERKKILAPLTDDRNCASALFSISWQKFNQIIMKTLLSILSISLFFSGVNAQAIYNFSTDPLSTGWSYYDDYGSSPYSGFGYNIANERIDYKLTTTVDASFIHTQLSSTLSEDYCIRFEITPTNSNNYNTFFPLILTPYEVTGSHLHPWRQNPISPSAAGPMQNIDFLAVEVFSSQLRFFNRDGNQLTGSSIMSMNPTFQMQANTTYRVELEISNSTTATLSVYEDAGYANLLGSSSYSIPVLDDMNHLYIANSNGNSNCTQFGYLDNYNVDACSGVGVESITFDVAEKQLVKIVDLLGRETQFTPNTPLIYVFSDGSSEIIMKVDY